jgi:DNA-binding NarL/FixJ family response regulator/tetratricopeptide (TPR) repeat protein
LFALLDESKARVRTLVAPAGYGKTTLAEQWVAREGRCGAWFTARSSATDVAALALGLARSSTAVVADCDVRLREHMRALPAPAENIETLAEILGEDLADWPSNAWLVIDDYHEVAQEARAEDFVGALVSVSPIQFLIASRVRPSWVSTKELMYGDVLEVNQAALAMDNAEAADVLVDRTPRSASGLVSLAHGWPAVIGLASVSSAEIEGHLDQVPSSLYRFFAEEVFAALGEPIQQALTTLSVAPVLDHELVGALLGASEGLLVIAKTLDVGILVGRESTLDLHPLARAFLEEKSGQLGLVPADGANAICLAHYRERRDWDAAFELIVRNGWPHELEAMLSIAMDELLDAARLSTLQRWCEFASDAQLDHPLFSVARAEVMLRRGCHIEAITHAETAARQESSLAYRAVSIAGRAAHLASREEEALGFYERAKSVAATDDERRDALWGELGCLIDLEDPHAEGALARLSEGVSLGRPREFVRSAVYRLYLQMRFGSLNLDEADVAYRILSAVNDPLVESSFLSGYAGCLALVARYDEAQSASADLEGVVRRYRLRFALPYALCVSATARAGLREWKRAEQCAREALALARESGDRHVEHVSHSLLVRILAQQGRVSAALDLPSVERRGGIKASRSELACSRALVLACASRTGEALDLVDEVRGLTNAVEPAVLTAAVEAICALRIGSQELVDLVAALADRVVATGALDLLVTSYRACPELLPFLLRGPRRDQVEALLLRIGDTDLAAAAGHPVVQGDDRLTLLTPRELEIHEFLCSGVTNRQIAQALFIEESTVKAHAHHIYDKLGVRSRRALAVHAALSRSNQGRLLPSSDDARLSE